MNLVYQAVSILACTSAASAQLVDPGFESNPLGNYVTVLNNFVSHQGIWGQENSTIVGKYGKVGPYSGQNMLRMDNDGLVVTQVFQVVDMSPWAWQISTGTAYYTIRAHFNAENLPAAQAYMRLHYYSAPNLGASIGSVYSPYLTLDQSASTWQSIHKKGKIPFYTNWAVLEIGYVNSTIGGLPGFVDDAEFTITPTPASASLLMFGAALAARRRR